MVHFDSGNHKYFSICNLNCETLGLSSSTGDFFNQWSANIFCMKVTKNITQHFPGQSTNPVVSDNPPKIV